MSVQNMFMFEQLTHPFSSLTRCDQTIVSDVYLQRCYFLVNEGIHVFRCNGAGNLPSVALVRISQTLFLVD